MLNFHLYKNHFNPVPMFFPQYVRGVWYFIGILFFNYLALRRTFNFFFFFCLLQGLVSMHISLSPPWHTKQTHTRASMHIFISIQICVSFSWYSANFFMFSAVMIYLEVDLVSISCHSSPVKNASKFTLQSIKGKYSSNCDFSLSTWKEEGIYGLIKY